MANSGLGISPLLHLGHVVLGDGELDHESLVRCEVAAIITHRRCDGSDVLNRAGNEPSRNSKFHNHREGLYWGLLLVESNYYRFHI